MFERVLTPIDPVVLALLAALPWWLPPAILLARLRSTPSLRDVPAEPPDRSVASTVSIILPARNESAHIAACVRSILASSWPALELIVVDDHSTDGTASLARDAAAGDLRFTLVSAPDLPTGWFGKQWACQTGARHATGDLLLFTDADTRHAPDLVTRLVRMRELRRAELMSVAGHQAMATVWERAVQPCVFTLILLRYGGTTSVENARAASDVVANGQCFMLSRGKYDALGGHEAVRDFVAEDLMMAQAVWSEGGRVSLVLGIEQLSTRMYDGLASLIEGWGKNVYAGGRFAMRGGAVGRALYPLLLLTFPTGLLAPFIGIGAVIAIALLSLTGMSPTGIPAPFSETVRTALAVWSVLTGLAVLLTFAAANRLNGDPVRRALLAPLGALVLLVICAFAVARGRNVRWKGRGYLTR